jgi:hypothetical protein
MENRQEVDFSVTTLKRPAAILTWTLKFNITRRKTGYSLRPAGFPAKRIATSRQCVGTNNIK